MPKVISRLPWFCITTLCDWFHKTCVIFSANGNPRQNQSCFCRTRFPALGTSYMYLFRILIGSLCCLYLLRLTIVVTLVLVLRHSIGNRYMLTVLKGEVSRKNLLSFQNPKMFVCQRKQRNNCQVCYKLSPQSNKTVD